MSFSTGEVSGVSLCPSPAPVKPIIPVENFFLDSRSLPWDECGTMMDAVANRETESLRLARRIFSRWGVGEYDTESFCDAWTGSFYEMLVFITAISVGLGELFNDDRKAEADWMNSRCELLMGRIPLEAILGGGRSAAIDVIDALTEARGLR